MSTATVTEDNKWNISVDLGKETGSGVAKTLTISAKNKYVDKDIIVDISSAVADGATLSASSDDASATIGSVTVGTKSSGSYPITGSAEIKGTATASTIASGFATKDTTTGTGSVSGTASVSASLDAAAATVIGSASATTPTIAIDGDNDNISVGTITTTKPSSGYYAAVKASAPATTLTMEKTVGTAGYLGSSDEITASAATTATDSSDYYVPITSGSLGTSTFKDTTSTGSDLTDYIENTSVAVPSGGSLILNEGYYPKTFITLDQILDGKNDTAGMAAADIRSGFVAYDVKGNKLTGTMGDVTPTFEGGSISADATASVTTAPTATITEDGSFFSSTSYGVTTTQPTTGTDGTDYLTIDGKLSTTSGTASAAATATGTAITYKDAKSGYLNISAGASAVSKPSDATDSDTATITVSETDSFEPYYIPIASGVTGSGGAVSASAGGSVTTDATNTNSASGSLSSLLSSSQPTTGTDGTDYYTLEITNSTGNAVVTATADASRTAVTYSNTAGVIAANSSTSLLSAADATQDTETVTVTVPTAEKITRYIAAGSHSIGSLTVNGTGSTVDGVPAWTAQLPCTSTAGYITGGTINAQFSVFDGTYTLANTISAE